MYSSTQFSLCLWTTFRRMWVVTGLIFLDTCFKRWHLVVFDTSSLPQPLKTSLLVRQRFHTTSLFIHVKVRFEATLELPSSPIDRTEIRNCTHFFVVQRSLPGIFVVVFPFTSSGMMVDFLFEISSHFSLITTLKMGTHLQTWDCRNVAATW